MSEQLSLKPHARWDGTPDESFEAYWRLRQEATWSGPGPVRYESWGAASKPEARKAWLAAIEWERGES